MTVTPLTAAVSGSTTLVFTYAPDSAQDLKGGEVTLTVPAGWTPPSTTPGAPGNVSASCPAGCVPGASGMTIMVTRLSLIPGQVLTITYAGATSPGVPGSYPFPASERSFPLGTLTALAQWPAVQVTCPDGAGSMRISPPMAAASGISALAFIYTAGSCGVQDGGQVTVTIPNDWPSPSATPGTAAYTSSSLFGPPALVGRTVTVTVTGSGLAPGQALTIRYASARAPAAARTDTFTFSERSSGVGTLTAIAPGTVSVTPPDGVGTMIVQPARVSAAQHAVLVFTYTAATAGLAPSGEVTLAVPHGWARPSRARGRAGYTSATPGVLSVHGRLITVTGVSLRPGRKLSIRYRAGTAPSRPQTWTFTASERTEGTAAPVALASSPAVTVTARSGPPWLVIFVAAGLAAAGGAAVAIAAVRAGRRRRGRPPPRVDAKPQPGPPGLMTVQNTGPDPTITVRIDPHPGAAVIVVERTNS